MKIQKQVAALPWRLTPAGLKVLLVTTRTTRRWMIPKGWPMRDRPDSAAAAEEAWEEAGVRGRIMPQAGMFSYEKVMDSGKVRRVDVAVYPLEVSDEHDDWPEQAERQRQWMSPQEAVHIVQPPELGSTILMIGEDLALQALRAVPTRDGAAVPMPPFQRLRAWLAGTRR